MPLDAWQPARVIRTPGGFALDTERVYRGSRYIASVQFRQYLPVFQQYLRGDILDAGCGPVPYYGIYRDAATSVTCLDFVDAEHPNPYVDVSHDLNEPLPFEDARFDSILLSDVLAHVYEQRQLMRECGRCLRPGGRLVLTTPFIYWISEFPRTYFHPTASALERMCAEAGLEIVTLAPYGTYVDVLLDTLNKGMTGPWNHHVFRLLAAVLPRTAWMHRESRRKGQSYPPGYILVAERRRP
ncbi:MAG: class I SAM-dependent methyltransferase [Vicinamibacterales bacterium]